MKFLHRLDALETRMVLVETSLDALRGASFLDGRETFWSEQSLADARDLPPADEAPSASAARWIFHVGFCGSTLLTRLLDSDRDTVCLREPQCLIDLSDQLSALQSRPASQGPEHWLARATRQLEAATAHQAPVVIKPSNWSNPLLPALARAGLLDHAVFVTMERRAWLLACLRGGRDRMAFVARCAQHTAQTSPGHAGLLAEAVAGSRATGPGDALDQVLRLAALLHALQEGLFDCVDPRRQRRLDAALIVQEPVRALHAARERLHLPCDDLDEAAITWHAKDPSQRFDAARRREEDQAVESEYAGRVAAAMGWIEEALATAAKPRDPGPPRGA
ncbi:hypothetical protein HT136_07825 [Novosphingobium profundi]|uniref:hypothetical protein n=1 Tax=Novosphingobium profundi TaxID=1774954 RepID=UPI001BDABC63|nr:hypothetical protein [Novosphingobium profundi]MBT0668274.1 hypothetical protein [Novosphingobium profundi]